MRGKRFKISEIERLLVDDFVSFGRMVELNLFSLIVLFLTDIGTGLYAGGWIGAIFGTSTFITVFDLPVTLMHSSGVLTIAARRELLKTSPRQPCSMASAIAMDLGDCLLWSSRVVLVTGLVALGIAEYFL